MNTARTLVRRALLSVSDKTEIIELALFLHSKGVEIISTGGTAATLTQAGITVIPIEYYSGSPEMMDGRVKTLHPTILGGILGLRDKHASEAHFHTIPWIDLVVCNLYPFEQIADSNCQIDEALDTIDIGGPTMIRSAVKNCGWVCVVTDPVDYQRIIQEITDKQSISFTFRREMAAKAFSHTARNDAFIQSYLSLGFTHNTISEYGDDTQTLGYNQSLEHF